ncbi:MAG: holo-ACP synthase [Thermoleophilaceae bacterium]
MAIRVGIDLVSVALVRDSLRDHAERYLERVYTDLEVSDCRSTAGIDPARLAARFAAKEAALKVLRPDAHAVPWLAIELRRDPAGWPLLELSGAAADLAADEGIVDLAVSLTHEGAYASAMVIAEISPTCR